INGMVYGRDFPATVSPFALDVFEVTVARFRNFVAAYDNWEKPAAGSGRDPNDENDMGWDPSWTSRLQPTRSDLEAVLACSAYGNVGTWTDSASSNEFLPIT